VERPRFGLGGSRRPCAATRRRAFRRVMVPDRPLGVRTPLGRTGRLLTVVALPLPCAGRTPAPGIELRSVASLSAS
jgi:hypothetical protein